MANKVGSGGDSGRELKVLGWWQSPFMARPLMALNLKLLDYEVVEYEFYAKDDLLLRSNPVYKRIPVLLHRDVGTICESMIIVQYLEDAFPSSGVDLLPADPYRRALARFWAAYGDDKVWPAILRIAVMPQTEEAMATTVKQVHEGLQLLEGAFVECSGGEGREFFNGSGIGYLDIAVGSCLGWLSVAEAVSGASLLGPDRFPRLAAWAERFLGHDAVRGVIPETDKLAKFAESRRAARLAAAAPPSATE